MMIARHPLTLLATALLLQGVAVGQYAQDAWGSRNVPQAAQANPSSAIRPIDAPSIVDRYRPRGFQSNPQPAPPVNVASAQVGQYPAQQYPVQPSPIQQTAYQVPGDQQQLAQPALPGGQAQGPANPFQNQQNLSVQGQPPQNFQNPQQPIAPSIAPPPILAQPQYGQTQPTYPQTLYPQPQQQYPLPQQQVSGQPFASMGTSPAISPASTWTAGGAWDCGNVAQTSAVSPQVYVPPNTYTPPVITPDLAPNAYAPNNAGYRPLVALGSPYPNVQVGRGIIGQPTVYVPNQPIRNFFRYLSP
ncbi:hypothetical protein [Rosistilla oblonga]|uniref:hypothetical protein n=1 Tax=Rosistilla oblonga TaxID=2527990 RepID=UPI003A96FEEB